MEVDPESNSQATHLTINNGGAYFNYPTRAGPFIGRYDLKTLETTRTDFRATSGSWHEAERVYGIKIGRNLGSSPHVALMNRSGATRLTALNP